MLSELNHFRNRIALLSGGLLLSLSLALVAYFYHLSSERLSIASGESLVSISQSISNMLTANLVEREREVILLSQRSSLYANNDLSALQESIDQIKNSYKDYAWIGFANVDGIVLASSNNMLKGENVSQRPWFIHGRSGSFIGDVHKALLLEHLLATPRDTTPLRFIDFSASVKGRNGELKGVVATHANWSWVKGVLSSSLTQTEKSKGIDIFIIDGEHNVLYPDNHLDKIKVPEALPSNGQFKSLTWQNGKNYLTSLVAVRSPESTNLGWQIVVRMPTVVAMSTVKEVHRLLLILGVGATLLCMMLAYKFASTLSRPLERLAQIAKSIQQGNRHVTFQDDCELSEIKILSRSLQDMMSSLLDREQSLVQMNATLEEKVRARTAELETLVRHDPLTNSFNRLALDEALLNEFHLVQESSKTFSIIMVDADHFKNVNDQYGHTVGDIVLKKMASLLAKQIRSRGMVARFGGEEFTVLLPNTDCYEAQRIAEVLRGEIEKTEMSEELFITASFGIAMYQKEDNHYEQVLKRADSALYQAKDQGRNRVVVSG